MYKPFKYYHSLWIAWLLAIIPIPTFQNSYAYAGINHPYCYDDNQIMNAAALAPFFAALYQLEQTATMSVSQLTKLPIVHIGDSHLQTDALTSVLRERLQMRFGNAGRGLIFPYRVAKTNEPTSYTSSGNAALWEAKRCVYPDNPIPIGVSGITLHTTNPQAAITLQIRNTTQLDYSFERVKVFSDTHEQAFDLFVDGAQLNFSAGRFLRKIDMAKPTNTITLQNTQTNTAQQQLNFYGISFENLNNGILYHTVAVNGTQYAHLNKAAYFAEQLAELEPKLIIISLGTNEAFGKDFTTEQFTAEITQLVAKLRQNCPGVVILLTTPANSFKYKQPNIKMLAAADALKMFASNNKLPYWDLNTIGGTAHDWKNRKMLQPDGVHFTSSGYLFQGDLFHQALITAYSQYVADKSR